MNFASSATTVSRVRRCRERGVYAKRGGTAHLWFFAWLVCAPAVGYGIGTGNLGVAAVAWVLLLLCLFFGLRKLVCPKCGKAVRTIGTRLTHCMNCGIAFDDAR